MIRNLTNFSLLYFFLDRKLWDAFYGFKHELNDLCWSDLASNLLLSWAMALNLTVEALNGRSARNIVEMANNLSSCELRSVSRWWIGELSIGLQTKSVWSPWPVKAHRTILGHPWNAFIFSKLIYHAIVGVNYSKWYANAACELIRNGVGVDCIEFKHRIGDTGHVNINSLAPRLNSITTWQNIM